MENHLYIHAYLAKHNLDVALHHGEMYLKYRTTISNALIQMYGTHEQVAHDLAFAGLTLEESKQPGYAWWDWHMSSVSPSISSRILNTLFNHQDATQGTPLCNP